MTPVTLRDLFQEESFVHRLTSSNPPVVYNTEEHTTTGGRVYYLQVPEEEPADRIGQSMSAEMVSLVGNVTALGGFYSPRYPLRRALADYERICRRRHRPPTWKDHATPICAEMLRARIEGGASIWWCAQYFEVSYPRAERLIAAGEAYIERSLIEAEARLLGVNVNAHGIDCPNPKTCPICSVDYSPSQEAKESPQPIMGRARHSKVWNEEAEG